MSDPVSPEAHADATGFLPGLAIDTVIVGFHEDQLKILLLEYRNTNLFALPGGFVREDENLNDAARRVLSERTGLQDIYLEQFYTFGDRNRYDAEAMRTIMRNNGTEPEENHWLLRRFVSVGYYALVDFTQVTPRPDALSDRCEWYDLAQLPPLMQDHTQIVEKALETLRENLDRKLIGFNLLPDTFTMGDLQRLYETVMGQSLHRPSFQRKMLGLGILERVAKKWTGGAHKAPYLYRFVSGKPSEVA
ncbi:ADP-ribose pyrophosphatase YjhB, NUDIX family [Catalinimonas alkaloidigena]|uniref:ADP-ribose pyrophosphatase YjhB, NUDIX family n=1 Tax=Catalinimonas alkaloidigena TaxID=1075417 RepID=A0A1G9R9Z3_9BACT|nr:NUDIX domain-containing protein [Catalinimonas alkaloidigena]SDM20044.1 ADP-ribose pyrophosphatase YjhB, NUDIX family [Catalinimonas alkaloidigena]